MNIQMKNLKTKNDISISLTGAVLLTAFIFTSVEAAPLTVTNTFTDGNVLTAGELNTNFGEVETAVNDNDLGINSNVIDIGNNSNAITDNARRLPQLKTVSIAGSVTVNTLRNYFTTDHLVATPNSDGYLYIEAKGSRNCSADEWTQANYGLFIANTSTPPTSATLFSYSETFGFAFIIDAVPNGGNHNVRIMHPHPVTGGVTYHIWYGVRGLNVTGSCLLSNPTITATFFQSGL